MSKYKGSSSAINEDAAGESSEPPPLSPLSPLFKSGSTSLVPESKQVSVLLQS